MDSFFSSFSSLSEGAEGAGVEEEVVTKGCFAQFNHSDMRRGEREEEGEVERGRLFIFIEISRIFWEWRVVGGFAFGGRMGDTLVPTLLARGKGNLRRSMVPKWIGMRQL